MTPLERVYLVIEQIIREDPDLQRELPGETTHAAAQDAPTPTRRAGRTPRTTNLPPEALPVAEEEVA
jgi:hypothetical protein